MAGLQPHHIQTLLEKLMSRKIECSEHVVVCDEQLLVSREACPAVLLPTNKHISEIILIQRFSQHNKQFLSSGSEDNTLQSHSLAEIGSRTPTKVRNGSTDLDMTGSPLKCPFMLSKEDTDFSPFTVSLSQSREKKYFLSYTPISCTKATLIASKFNLALTKMSSDIKQYLSLWVVCDGKDSQGMYFLGFQRDGDKMTRTIVTASGPYQGSENLPSLDHMKMHHTAIGPTKRVESAVEAAFNVLTSDEDNKKSSLKLICSWKKPLAILSPPAPNANTMARLRIVCSDPRSAAHQMYRELNVLRGLVSGLFSGEVAWFTREEPKTISEELEEVFAIIREKVQWQKKEGVSDFDASIREMAFNKRQNMDFTDLLWTVLIRCVSYQELKESLGLVFKAVMSGEVRPEIHVRNITQVGSLSRNLMQGHEAFPNLSGLVPLQMLIEMGCEKIKRDYISIFQVHELATGEQLSWFVNNSEASPEMIIVQLERLHVALQVVVSLRTYLRLPPASLTQFTAQVLNLLREEEPKSAYSFSFRLETLTVHQLLNSMKVDTWELNLCSRKGNFTKTLVCHISHHPLIQIPSTDSELEMMENTCVDDKSEDRYYCCFINSATDKRFP